MKKKFIIAIIASLCFLNNPTFAIEETDMQDDGKEQEIKKILYGQLTDKEIYSLNNYATDAGTSGASVDIITRDDIKNQNTPTINNLLNQTMSVTFGQGSGGFGQPSNLIIRGSDRVMFTIDGVRIDTITGTKRNSDLKNFLNTDDFERIEIIRGPQGTIAGHTASGGMITTQTRRGKGRLKTEAESMFGSNGYFKERFAIMGGNEKADHYSAITWFKTDDGTYLEDDGKRGDNSYNNLNLVGNYAIRFLDGKGELRNISRYSRGRKNIGMDLYYGGKPDYDYAITQDFTDSLTWKHQINKIYDYDIKTSIYNTNYDMHYNPSPFYEYGRTHERISQNGTRFDIGTQHNFQLTSWDKLSIGYNFEVENYRLQTAGLSDWGNWIGLQPDFNYTRQNTLQHDVFIQDCINIKDILYIRGGARLVNNSSYGTWVMPNGSAALVLPTFKIDGAKTTFRGSWGQNVNTPTLYQRFGDGGSLVAQNNELEPERVNSWDAGITQSLFDDKLSIDFGYFNSAYKNYIQGEYNYSTWLYSYNNVDKVNMQGYEGKITYKPNEKFKFIINYTYTDAENKSTHTQLDLVSNNKINGTIVWTPVERFQGYIGIEGGTERTLNNGTITLPGYVDVNLGALVRLLSYKDVHVYLQGDLYNLLNQKIGCGYYTNSQGKASRVFKDGINLRLGLFAKYSLPEKESL